MKPPNPTTNLWANPYVHQVLEFMQATVPPDQLCGVADAVNRVAPALWSHQGQQRIVPLVLFKAQVPPEVKESANADALAPVPSTTSNTNT